MRYKFLKFMKDFSIKDIFYTAVGTFTELTYFNKFGVTFTLVALILLLFNKVVSISILSVYILYSLFIFIRNCYKNYKEEKDKNK